MWLVLKQSFIGTWLYLKWNLLMLVERSRVLTNQI